MTTRLLYLDDCGNFHDINGEIAELDNKMAEIDRIVKEFFEYERNYQALRKRKWAVMKKRKGEWDG